MAHSHQHHHHHHVSPEAGDGRVVAAIGVNVLLTVAQVAGGIVAGSLALVADGLHNLSDAAALIIAYVARRIARRGSDASMTFGYRRIEIVAALVNYTTLIVLGLYLAEDRDPIGGRTLTNAVIVVPGKTDLRAGRGQRAVALHDQDHLR